MFRPLKKKIGNKRGGRDVKRLRLLSDDVEDFSDSQSSIPDNQSKVVEDVVVLSKQKYDKKNRKKNSSIKKKGNVISNYKGGLSFTAIDDDNFNDTDITRKDEFVAHDQKKRSTRIGTLGFGGNYRTNRSGEDGDNGDDDDASYIKTGQKNSSGDHSSTSLYDKEMLKLMLSQQKDMQMNRTQQDDLIQKHENGVFPVPFDDLDDDVGVGVGVGIELQQKVSNYGNPIKSELEKVVAGDSLSQKDYIPLERVQGNTAVFTNKINTADDTYYYNNDFVMDMTDNTIQDDSKNINEIILTGDEAISLHEKSNKMFKPESIDGNENSEDDDFIQFVEGTSKQKAETMSHSKNDNTITNRKTFVDDIVNKEGDDNDDDEWVSEVTRRAGGIARTVQDLQNETIKSTHPTVGFSLDRKTNNLHMVQLRQKFQTSIKDLEVQQNDTDRIEVRREADLQQLQDEIQRQENELHVAGIALEFYQTWRERLVSWVGAIRELREKVELILVSYHQLESERVALSRWEDWENDCIAVLHQHKLLDRVIGRQPSDVIFQDTMMTVDEFGRDAKSQHVLQREQRRRRIKRIIRQRKDRNKLLNRDFDTHTSDTIVGTESDGFISDDEELSFRQRRVALRHAISVVTDDMEEEYTDLHNLVGLFKEWYQQYPEEYKQCYAELSLADLAAILVQIELCSLDDPWNESAENFERKWMHVIHTVRESGLINDGAVDRLIDRSVRPAIMDLLDKSGINLASTKQTKSFAAFIRQIRNLLPKESKVMVSICNRIVTYTNQQLERFAIPVLIDQPSLYTSDSLNTTDADNFDELVDSIYTATSGQIHRIKRVVLNLIRYWVPLVVPDDFVYIETILHFITKKFLALLSSIRNFKHQQIVQIDCESLAESTFKNVIEVLTIETNWFQRDDLMLQSAPLRAAMKSFQC